jgi:Fe-S cluster assembly protein SufD
VIVIGRNTVLKDPVQIVFCTTERGQRTAVYPRVLIVAEAGSESAVVECHIGLGQNCYFSAPVREALLGEDARLTHHALQLESRAAYHLSGLCVEQRGGSTFESFAWMMGGALSRNEVQLTLNGEGCQAGLYGLSLGEGEQHLDNHTIVEHAQPRCRSYEVYKGIYGGRSKGVFDGTIVVQPHAQKTDAIQYSRSLLLSKDASSSAKPQLKIWADDVKCTHAATVGQLDEEGLFYLRSRGIGEQEARSMLVQAFAGEVLEKIALQPVREHIQRLVEERLAGSKV